MKYNITVNEKQLRLIQRGLEAIARAGTKQYDYALEQLDPTLFERVGGLHEMWNIRDHIRASEGCGLPRHASLGISNASDDARISYDMYQVIAERYHSQRSVLPDSKEELITIKESK